MPRSLLFVDDEPMVLKALERVLRPMRSEWEFTYATGGAEALEIMSHQCFDAVVTDMRMPGMSGAELLEEIRRRYPRSIRFVLSGESDRETALRAANSAHQYLAKPCDVGELKLALTQALALRDVLDNDKLKEVVSQITDLPSIPSLYVELLHELQSPLAGDHRFGEIIERDIAMTSKLLKIANSSLFGLRSQVSSAARAVSVLGTETVKSLVLSIGIFSGVPESMGYDPILRALWENSVQVSVASRRMAEAAGMSEREQEDAFTAGLLHDIGKLVLYWKLPDQWEKIQELARKQGIPQRVAEHELLTCTHAEIGAYLMGTWSLPYPIIEATAWHHHPSQSLQKRVGALMFVHLADNLFPNPSEGNFRQPLDLAFIENCGVMDSVNKWMDAALAPEEDDDESHEPADTASEQTSAKP